MWRGRGSWRGGKYGMEVGLVGWYGGGRWQEERQREKRGREGKVEWNRGVERACRCERDTQRGLGSVEGLGEAESGTWSCGKGYGEVESGV